MQNQELLSYIQKQFSKNIGKEKIRQALLSAGWAIVDIEAAFSEIEAKAKTQQTPQFQTKQDISRDDLKRMVKENPDYYYFPKKQEQFSKQPENSIEPKKEVEKIFQQGVAKNPNQESNFLSRKIEPVAIKKTDLPKTGNPIAKIMIPIIVIVVAIICAYLYFYWQEIKDPVSLVPNGNDIVLRINTDPTSPQIRQFQEILNRIPFFKSEENFFSSKYDGIKDKEFLKTFFDSIKSGKVKSIISFLNINTKKIGLIIPGIAGKETNIINQTKNFFEENIGKAESEKYQDMEIFKIYNEDIDYEAYYASSNSSQNPYDSIPKKKTLMVVFSGIGDNLVIANDEDQVKNVIDNYKKMNLAAVFSKGSVKSLKNTESFKKLKKYLPKDYLVYFYGNIDFSKMDALSLAQNLKEFSYLNSLTAALQQTKTTETSNGMLFYIKAQDYGFELKQYLAGFPEGIGGKFNISQSLSNQLPEKIGGENAIFYTEANDLKKIFNYSLDNSYNAYQKATIDNTLSNFKEASGIDIKKIIDNIDGQFSGQLAYNPLKSKAGISFIFAGQSSNASKIEQSISFKSVFNQTEIANYKEKETSIANNFSLLRSYFEIYYSNKGFYPLYIQSDPDIKEISEYIKTNNQESNLTYNSSYKSYCAYAKLIAKDAYYCIDSTGNNGYSSFPGIAGACSGKSYICPKDTGNFSISDNLYPVSESAVRSEEIDGAKIQTININPEIELSFARKGDMVYFTIGGKDLIKDVLNNKNKKLSDSPEFASFPEMKNNIYALSFLKPVPIAITFAKNFGFGSIELQDSELILLSKISSGMSEIFPIINSYSYDDNGIMAGQSKIEIKDIGQSKIKELKNNIDKFFSEMKSSSYNSSYDYSSKPQSSTTKTENIVPKQDSGDDYIY